MEAVWLSSAYGAENIHSGVTGEPISKTKDTLFCKCCDCRGNGKGFKLPRLLCKYMRLVQPQSLLTWPYPGGCDKDPVLLPVRQLLCSAQVEFCKAGLEPESGTDQFRSTVCAEWNAKRRGSPMNYKSIVKVIHTALTSAAANYREIFRKTHYGFCILTSPLWIPTMAFPGAGLCLLTEHVWTGTDALSAENRVPWVLGILDRNTKSDEANQMILHWGKINPTHPSCCRV